MTTTKTIKITGKEILEYYVSVSEECTIMEARDLISKALIDWNIKESGDYDRGTHRQWLEDVEVTL
jgi:hypothetical protein